MKLRKCVRCNMYTFKDSCLKCKGETRNPNPPKYSPEDAYGKYRRLGKQFK